MYPRTASLVAIETISCLVSWCGWGYYLEGILLAIIALLVLHCQCSTGSSEVFLRALISDWLAWFDYCECEGCAGISKDIERYASFSRLDSLDAIERRNYIYILLGDNRDSEKQLLRRGVSSGRGTNSLFWVLCERRKILSDSYTGFGVIFDKNWSDRCILEREHEWELEKWDLDKYWTS